MPASKEKLFFALSLLAGFIVGAIVIGTIFSIYEIDVQKIITKPNSWLIFIYMFACTGLPAFLATRNLLRRYWKS
jgi:uncharacterized membrane protein